MGAVVGSVALAEAGAPVAAPVAVADTPGTMSFADDAPVADREAAIMDEVLSGSATAGEAAPAAEGGDAAAKPEDKPAAKPAEAAKEEPPANDIEAAKLRKGFAKLADERQKLVELQNTARTATQNAQQYAEKARKHDELTAAIDSDPAGFLLARGGEELVQKALKGFIDMEKSPAEREVAKMRAELADRDTKAAQRDQETAAANWRNGITAKVQADERFELVNTLGLHTEVVNVITGYYEKHSERDDKGNVTKPALLPWDTAAQAVEDTRAAMLDKSKRYGKRTPVAAEETPAKKDAPTAKPVPASAKKAPTSLSSVPVAETPPSEDDYPTDDLDARQTQVLASLGID